MPSNINHQREVKSFKSMIEKQMADFVTIFIFNLQVKESATVTVLKHKQLKTLPFKKFSLVFDLFQDSGF